MLGRGGAIGAVDAEVVSIALGAQSRALAPEIRDVVVDECALQVVGSDHPDHPDRAPSGAVSICHVFDVHLT
jgi:hypothetical protein